MVLGFCATQWQCEFMKEKAEAGDAVAQCDLGLRYAIVQAHAWMNNASANGHESAKKNLGILEKKMTPEQIAEAMKLAREIFERIQAKKK